MLFNNKKQKIIDYAIDLVYKQIINGKVDIVKALKLKQALDIQFIQINSVLTDSDCITNKDIENILGLCNIAYDEGFGNEDEEKSVNKLKSFIDNK